MNRVNRQIIVSVSVNVMMVFQRRLCTAAKKALAKIPTKHIKLGDKVSLNFVFAKQSLTFHNLRECLPTF